MISQIRPARRAGGSTPRARSPSEHPDVRPWPRSRSRGTAVARLRSPADSEATARGRRWRRWRFGHGSDRIQIATTRTRSSPPTLEAQWAFWWRVLVRVAVLRASKIGAAVLVARSGAGCRSSRHQTVLGSRLSGGAIWRRLQILAPPESAWLVWWRDLVLVADLRASRIGAENRGGESGLLVGLLVGGDRRADCRDV